MIINLHIERLVLEGLPLDRLSGPAIEQAVRAELERSLDGASFQQGGAVASLRTNDISVAKAEAAGIGMQIASALHERLVK